MKRDFLCVKFFHIKCNSDLVLQLLNNNLGEGNKTV